MNNDEILNLKPGRELDIKVALEVMDYVWLKHLLQFSAELAVKWLGTKTELKESCGMFTIVTESQFLALKERENHAESVLNFSTEMEAASQVIAHMQELGYEYSLVATGDGEKNYVASFTKSGIDGVEESIAFTTVPEAIVKTALLVMKNK